MMHIRDTTWPTIMAGAASVAMLLGCVGLPAAHASTLTWTGGGDGASFAQLANWNGTPNGGTIDIGNLVDSYVVDTPANITNVLGSLRFREGGGVSLSAGSLDLLASGSLGIGLLETPDSFGQIDLDGGSVSAQFLAEINVDLAGDGLLTLAGGNNPINNSSINFSSADAQLLLPNETPSAFTSEHLNKITVFGSPAVVGANLQVVGDGGAGSIVTPLGSFDPVAKLLVDRDTGNLTLSNTTGQAIEFLAYDIFSPAGAVTEAAWTSVSGNYDATTSGGDGSVDPDDPWFRFTAPGSRTDLAEGSLGEATLAQNQTIDLGDAWIAGPAEDLVATLALTNGADMVVEVEYSGTTLSEPIELADLNADGVVDAADWPSLRENLFSDVSTLLTVDALAAGDLDGSGRVDEFDFERFKAAFDAANGAGAFAAMAARVPEPTTLLLVLCGGSLFFYHRIRPRA